MANVDLTGLSQPPPAAEPGPVGRHRNLMLTSAIMATVGMLVAAAYGISEEFQTQYSFW